MRRIVSRAFWIKVKMKYYYVLYQKIEENTMENLIRNVFLSCNILGSIVFYFRVYEI